MKVSTTPDLPRHGGSIFPLNKSISAPAHRSFSRVHSGLVGATGLAFSVATLALSSNATLLQAGTQRTQTHELHAGWNAVVLEVQPGKTQPGELFNGLPVDTVACYLAPSSLGNYRRNPGDALWKEEGWAVWYPTNQPQSFLTTLTDVPVRRPLLIRATADFVWTVQGEVRTQPLEWQPNACTLTSLPVDPAGGPTFADFFAGSPAHQNLRVYRLESGNWKLIRQPAVDRARSGEAYWIETSGGSKYQGPLRINLPASGDISLDIGNSGREFAINNDSAKPTTVRVESVGGADALPLRQAKRQARSLATERTPFAGVVELPLGTPGTDVRLVLEPDRGRMTTDMQGTLLRFSDGRGTLWWVPIRARRAPPVGTAAAVQP